MRLRKKIWMLSILILLGSAGFVFASLPISRLPQLALYQSPANELLPPIETDLAIISNEQSESVPSKLFLEYKAWRAIQVSA